MYAFVFKALSVCWDALGYAARVFSVEGGRDSRRRMNKYPEREESRQSVSRTPSGPQARGPEGLRA